MLLVMDDWGYNDVGFHKNTDTQTSFLDTLAMDEGLRLETHYVYASCTPTRAALLSGRYVSYMGLQDGNLER